MDHFLAMGGYAVFVWPAYGVALVVLAGITAVSLGNYRRTKRALDAAQAGRKKS